MIRNATFKEYNIDSLVSCLNEGFSDYCMPIYANRTQLENMYRREVFREVITYQENPSTSKIDGILLFGHRKGIPYSYISGFAVVPKKRNAGIGSKLMKFAHTISKESGYSSIRLEVLEQNSKAIQFYKRMGYKQIDQIYSLIQRFPEKNHLSTESINLKVRNLSFRKALTFFQGLYPELHSPWQKFPINYGLRGCKIRGVISSMSKNNVVGAYAYLNQVGLCYLRYFGIQPGISQKNLAEELMKAFLKEQSGISEIHVFNVIKSRTEFFLRHGFSIRTIQTLLEKKFDD